MKHEESLVSQRVDDTNYSYRVERTREHNPLIELFTVFVMGVFLLSFSLLFLRASFVFASSCPVPTVQVGGK